LGAPDFISFELFQIPLTGEEGCGEADSGSAAISVVMPQAHEVIAGTQPIGIRRKIVTSGDRDVFGLLHWLARERYWFDSAHSQPMQAGMPK
jgi:hypothetical protein